MFRAPHTALELVRLYSEMGETERIQNMVLVGMGGRESV